MTENTPTEDLRGGLPVPASNSVRAAAAARSADAGQRKLPGHLVRVVLEDELAEDGMAEFVVRVDNRDLVRWDKTAPARGWKATDHPFIFQSFVAWSAAVRVGATLLKFDLFQDRALEVADLQEEAAADPTQ